MKAAWKNGRFHLELTKAEAWDLKMSMLLARGEGQLMAKSITGGTISDFTGPLKLALTLPEAKTVERTFATKAERAAGKGYPCPNCNRRDLRVEVKPGRSFHDKDVKGNTEICDLR